MQGWRYPQEEDFGKKCQRWVVTRDSASCCEHDDCNIAVFKRTLLSSFTPNREKNHLFGRKIRMVQPDSLNVGTVVIPQYYIVIFFNIILINTNIDMNIEVQYSAEHAARCVSVPLPDSPVRSQVVAAQCCSRSHPVSRVTSGGGAVSLLAVAEPMA